MLAIEIEFLHGTFRGDPDGTANTGGLTRGEWPPAPARLFAALVAADGTGDRCRVTDGSELEWFERLPAPVIHAHSDPWHQPLRPRYVVRHDGKAASKPKHPGYLGRMPIEVRPGVRVSPKHPVVAYVWGTDAPDNILAALRRRAARVGYLGAADSPVRMRVSTEPPRITAALNSLVPDPMGPLAIGVPQPGDLELLDRLFEAWTERGATVSRAQFGGLRHRAGYRPGGLARSQNSGGCVAWMRLEVAVSGRRVSVVTDLFKKAVLSRYQKIHGEPPPVLHGHGFESTGFDLARFLALPDVGYPRSRGRIHGLALWLPPECATDLRARVRETARSVRRLVGNGVDVAVSPWIGEKRPVAASPGRWMRQSRCWASAFPVIHERRGHVDLSAVTRWCQHAGLPKPRAFRSSRSPLVSGAVDLSPIEANRPGRRGRPYSHVKIWFDEPVTGPVVLGAGRQRGLGLCVDVDEHEEHQ